MDSILSEHVMALHSGKKRLVVTSSDTHVKTHKLLTLLTFLFNYFYLTSM